MQIIHYLFTRKTKTKADKTVFVRILRSIRERKRKRKQTKQCVSEYFNKYKRKTKTKANETTFQYHDHLINENESENKTISQRILQ